jgi:Lrp/AsnC family transcriptional regulator for asnA, asnC and gidA
VSDSLDDLDRRIVSALARDGRRPYRDIARELGVSEGTVRSRMTRLQDQELIRVTAVGSPLALGVGVVALIMLRVKPGHVQDAARRLTTFPNIRFVGTSFGSADITIQSLHRDVKDLHGFVSEILPGAIPEITSTETFQLAEVLKSTWTWGDWFEYIDNPSVEAAASESLESTASA